MLELNNIKFNKGSLKKKKRVARGNSGKSDGRGTKGQKDRTGVSLGNFQGGQTPLERRLPKQRTFFTPKKAVGIKLESIDHLIAISLIDPKNKIDSDFFKKIGYIKKNDSYKLIGKTVNKIEIEAHNISKGAKKSIEEQKGVFQEIVK